MEMDSSIVQDEQNSCEDTLTELTSRFRSAISFYGCTSLNDQLEDNNELKENLKLKFAERLVKLADLKEKLSNDGTTVSDDLNIIDEESQALTLDMWRKNIESNEKVKECKMKKRL
ncbi:PREDICTED: uncharacterized protein LOC109593120, partial [Amphimedon queenslandica]